MKSVLISIKPKWVEKIANKEKTIEVRKTRPKIKTPFKCYIYCTIGNGIKGDYLIPSNLQCGKVIGEFVCDKVFDLPFTPAFQDYDFTEIYRDNGYKDFSLKSTCLTQNEIYDYGKGKPLYGWHISDLKIYDKPKELGEFKRWNRTEENVPCAYTKWLYSDCKDCKACNLTRPPQSWCYVESLGE